MARLFGRQEAWRTRAAADKSAAAAQKKNKTKSLEQLMAEGVGAEEDDDLGMWLCGRHESSAIGTHR